MRTICCQAALFDCDGVLVDSNASVMAAWARWARQVGLDPAKVCSLVHGRRSADTVELLVPERRRAEELARIDGYELEDAAGVRAVAGAVALLGRLPRERWAVVTSGRAVLARARLQAAGLPCPEVLVAAEDVAAGKPDPAGYRMAAARLGVSTAAAVVLEDAPAGVEAARAAGAGSVIGVGERVVAVGVDIWVPDLTALRWAGEGLELGGQPPA
ncbi:MAG: HAD-IA family hydrolase [Acidimicrobiales bacterium]